MKKLTKQQKAEAYDGIMLVKKFNELYPVGSKVTLRKVSLDSYPWIECTVKAPAFSAHRNGSEPAAFFEEISGYFSIEPDFVKYPS